MTTRMQPTLRGDYPHFDAMPTRWGDNDSYGHVNNVVYYAFFDSAVNRHLIQHGVVPGETRRRYGADGYGLSMYISDPEGNVIELKGPPA